MNILKRFIDYLFGEESKEPIKTGGEYLIILPEMRICQINDSSKYRDYVCKTYLLRRLFDSIACNVGRLVKGGRSDLEVVPEGYGVEMLPDVYIMKHTSYETEIPSNPMVLRKIDEDEYEVAYLSKTKERRLRQWWDIRNALPSSLFDIFILKKITPQDFSISNTDESLDLFDKLYSERS